MSNGLPERQAIIDLYDVELDTAHSQMCSTDYKECCQQSHDEFVKALDENQSVTIQVSRDFG